MKRETIYYAFTVHPYNWWRAVMYTSERGKPEIVHIATTTEDRKTAERFCEEHCTGTIDWERSDPEMSIGKVIR